MTTRSPWIGLGVVGLRLADVTARYLLAYAAGWLAVGLTAPREHELSNYLLEGRTFWEDTRRYLETGVDCVPMIAVPSVVIIWLFALMNERTGMAFRLRLAGLLLPPLWFLLFTNIPDMFWIMTLTQIAFALVLMRVPLIRENAWR